MKKVNVIAAAAFIIAGLLIAFGPRSIFSVCPADGDMKMRCFYTAQAELAIGLLITVLGIIFLIQKRSESKASTAISIAFSSVVAFLIPNGLIGVCGAAHMHCKAATQPALTLISILTFIISAVTVFALAKQDSVSFKERRANA